MGVAGCGKTTLAQALAQALGMDCLDADDLHTDDARAKMAAGVPLTDEDRAPWLARLNAALRENPPLALACSALKQSYRDRIFADVAPLPALIWLDAPRELIAQRLAARAGHYFSPALIDSQFAILEPDPRALRVNAAAPVAEAVHQAQSFLARL
jgi:carbohydrate kinase (thermoresistant glucokinase family)